MPRIAVDECPAGPTIRGAEMNNDTHCSICDEKKMELYDWYHSQQEILARDFHEGLLALAEAHANGEHDESAGMTMDEFEREYASRSGITQDDLHEMDHYAVPCNCGEPECKGWKMRNIANLMQPGLHFATEHIPDNWDGQDLLDALIADGNTRLVALFRHVMEQAPMWNTGVPE